HIDFGWNRDGDHLAGEIVGVVGDVRQHGLSQAVTPHIYAAWDQWPIDEITVVMRSRGDPAVALKAARAAVLSLDRVHGAAAHARNRDADRARGEPRARGRDVRAERARPGAGRYRVRFGLRV